MVISQKEWKAYIDKLSKLNRSAVEEFSTWAVQNGGYANINRQDVIDRAYIIAQKYGAGSAALSAQMYDEVAERSGLYLDSAIPADVFDYHETAKAINGAIKQEPTDDDLAEVVGRIVKQAGCDTTLKNAKRDYKYAEFAWIPNGDTCVYCLAIASNGWQPATKANAQGDHAEHIHPHCDCTYAIRFDSDTRYDGYEPAKYKAMYDSAEGSTAKEKINFLRREQYAENSEEINEQKREAYKDRMLRKQSK